MRVFLLVFHLLVTLVLIGVILIQRGEDAGAGGGSGGLPGARSGKNPLTRVTAVLATIFFADCLGMAILIKEESKIGSEAEGKSESLPPPSPTKPSVLLPVNREKQGPVTVNDQTNKQKSDSGQPSNMDGAGKAGSNVKSPVVSKVAPSVASKPGVVTEKKSVKSRLNQGGKTKKKSKDRLKKSA
jgi:preprotein translocase subunit SecG